MDTEQELITTLESSPKAFVEDVYQGACVETAKIVLDDYITRQDKQIKELESEIRRLKHKPATGFGLTLTRRDRLNQ